MVGVNVHIKQFPQPTPLGTNPHFLPSADTAELHHLSKTHRSTQRRSELRISLAVSYVCQNNPIDVNARLTFRIAWRLEYFLNEILNIYTNNNKA